MILDMFTVLILQYILYNLEWYMYNSVMSPMVHPTWGWG